MLAPTDRDHVLGLLERIGSASDIHDQLSLVYEEAMTAGILGLVVDEHGSTIEGLLWQRRGAIQSGAA